MNHSHTSQRGTQKVMKIGDFADVSQVGVLHSA
jgi:hypothetical protein